jgi:hypothetical protein
MRRLLLGLIAVALAAQPARAQLSVYDPANTARNTISAIYQQYLLETEQAQHAKLWAMARRLSAFADLRRYALLDVPRWRTHGGDFLYANGINDALIFGDPRGGVLAVSHPVLSARAALGRLTPTAQRVMASRLATLEMADAVAMSAINDTGSLRLNGRKQELQAIDALEAQVIDPALEQSATAVLDKISGSVLLGARQRQARSQLLTAFVEQLLVDSKRARDVDTTAMNMQLVTWRDSRAANAAFVAGTETRCALGDSRKEPGGCRAAQSLAHDSAGHREPADVSRRVPAIRIQPLSVVRDHPDRLAGRQDDVLPRQPRGFDVRVREAPDADLVRLLVHRVLRSAAAWHRSVVQQPDYGPDGLLPERARGSRIRQHLPAF